MAIMRKICGLTGVIAGLLAASAYGATISRFSPQGEIAQVRQVRATFSEAAVTLGDPKAPTPFDVKCAASGSGRWADERNWVYDFTQDVPVGQQCSFTLKPEFKSVAGNSFSGKSSFQFNTGGPAVLRVSPYDGSNIEEEQAFILLQSAAATEASMRQHVYCEIEGVHERVPVKFLTGANREALLKEFAKNTDPARVSTVQCQQRFPADAAVRLVWEKGISTANGIAATHSQTFVYHSRPAFTATVNCERENANAACTPILPLTLNFSAGIERKLAEQIVLKSGGSSIKPDIRKDNDEELISQVRFKPPFAEKAELTVELPSNLNDDSGRTLENAAQFPLKIKTAEFPPLAKFPAAPFGIVELNADATLPVTLRNVEQNLIARSANAKQAPGQLANLKVDSDAAIIEWISRLNKYHETTIKKNGVMVETRAIGLLEKEPNVQKLNLPASPEHATRPFEVIGIPFKDPGFYVLELESQKLGASLLGKRAPMFVRTSALVTNLAVHIKMGRENGAIWVTTLDNAKPVADADVQISDCYGKSVWKGKTTRNGVVIVPLTLDGACPQSDQANKAEPKVSGYFVSARKTDEKGRADMAFALSSWNNGIEAYRFNLPTDTSKLATVKAHTILDRSLFRAGETVSMKHIIRVESMNGLRLQKEELLPNRIRIIHQGSNQEFQFPLTWRDRNVAESTFAIPKQAKLGRYQIVLDSGKVKTDDDTKNASDDAEGEPYHENTYYTSSFRVEEFRLPLLQGRIVAPKGVQISPKNLPLDVQLNYINGGGAAGLPVHITSMLRSHAVSFPSYEQYSFDAYEENPEDQKIVANKIAVTLDKNGTGKTLIPHLPEIKRPQELLTEMTYADPNGEIQTMSTVTPLWPSAVIVGIKNEEWVSVKNKTRLTAIALDTTGKPLAGVPISISAVAKKNNSHRKRIVGGFYAYENVPTSQDLGKICSGKSDARGLLLCEVDLKESGNIELTATATDDNGQAAFAKTSMWVTGLGELWFEGENLDRMDVIPEKKQYQPGEIAKFQIRMPFRYATALIAVEREGVITTSVVKLNGRDPTVQLPIKAEYGPNIFVSVLAVRGRMREVPWYSFFTWGWKEALNWWHEFREYQFPSATVDLAKPAFKYGIAEIAVGTTGHQLKVDVTSDKSVYPIRAVSKVNIQVTLPDGRPAAGAEVAVAAVDEALLELQPNDTWDVLPVMLQRRSYGVETATAQMQVIGKRHYGRKAVAAGGGGGKAPTRELFDTLLLWKPTVKLDAKGRAQVEVPLNDALTSFRIVAIAQSGESYFGKGSTSIRATQDLQLVSGLPPLIREGDHYTAMFTVRNTTTHGMSVSVQASASGAGVSDIAPLPVQTLQIPAGEAREANWSVLAPLMNGDVESQQVQWEVKAQEIAADANRQTKVEALPKDAIKVSQRLIAAVPVTVQQASLVQLDKTFSVRIAQPANSLPGRGGLAVNLTASLSNGTNGLHRYFERYPYSCLEQKVSRAIGLQDAGLWQKVMNELPTYLDGDGLAYYYPPSDDGQRRGSDTLTSYLLSASQEAGYLIPDQMRERMLQGLLAFVDGKITRDFWSPRKDLEVRKLAALETLSRYNLVEPRMLGSIQINPNLWPTGAVLDWYAILQRTASLPQRDTSMKEAEQILLSRLNYQGTRLGFSSEKDDYWWWLMGNGDANANRLLLIMLNNPGWQSDLPKLMNGAIQRQVRGHWMTTNANVWGLLALQKFAQKFESEKVGGTTHAVILQAKSGANLSQSYQWLNNANSGQIKLPWPQKPTQEDTLKLAHDGAGKPWANLQSLAVVPLKAPFSAGFRIKKTWTPVVQKVAGKYNRGDVFRINIDVDAQTDMSWVVVSDPIPAGSSVLGSGLGRDSEIANTEPASASAEKDRGNAWPAYEEHSFDAYRSYFQYVPKGKFSLSYTVRLNNAGDFHLPATRVEAMYAPEMFGESPNAALSVK